MKCPACGCSRSKTVQTRVLERQHYRRRMCVECGERFNTIETFTRLGVPKGNAKPRVPKLDTGKMRRVTKTVEQLREFYDPGSTKPAPDPTSGTEDWRKTFERKLRGGKDR